MREIKKSLKGHLSAVGQTDTWITPKSITEALGEFDLDPCAHTEMPWQHAHKQFTINEDGLKQDWHGRVWLNPPFDFRIKHLFMEKMKQHGDGVMLISVSPETKAWKRHVWGAADGILMMNERPRFCYPDGTQSKANSGQSICLVAYGKSNLEALFKSRLGFVVREIQRVTVIINP